MKKILFIFFISPHFLFCQTKSVKIKVLKQDNSNIELIVKDLSGTVIAKSKRGVLKIKNSWVRPILNFSSIRDGKDYQPRLYEFRNKLKENKEDPYIQFSELSFDSLKMSRKKTYYIRFSSRGLGD
jgi:hypothetical protein